MFIAACVEVLIHTASLVSGCSVVPCYRNRGAHQSSPVVTVKAALKFFYSEERSKKEFDDRRRHTKHHVRETHGDDGWGDCWWPDTVYCITWGVAN